MKKILTISIISLVLFILSWTGLFLGAETLNNLRLCLLKEVKNITLIFSVVGFFVYTVGAISASVWED